LEASYPTAVVSPYVARMHVNMDGVGLAATLCSAYDYNYNDDRDMSSFGRGSFFTCNHFTPVKNFSAYLVESKHTGHDAPTSLTGAYTLARDSSHASTRSRGPAGGG